MDRELLEALLTPAALGLVETTPPPASQDETLRLVERLRREGHDATFVSAVAGQVRLREAARAKFGMFAERMLFTPAGLEQATRLRVAALRAGRFRAIDPARVVDLGCGIGGDALALAGLDLTVAAVDADEVTAAVATYNLASFPRATVSQGLAQDFPLRPGDAVFLDPARRTSGDGARRLNDPEQFSPPLSFALGIASAHPTAIKLGPALDRDLVPPGAEAQWVSVDRSVVEVCLWTGTLARPGIGRAALVLTNEGAEELTAAEDSPPADVHALGEYLHEPDGAVIRAGLVGLLAQRLGAGVVAPGIAYLTSNAPAEGLLAQSFRIVERLPAREKDLARALRERGIGTLEIKKRGADVDPAVLRKRLKLAGPNAATLFLTREGERHVALLAERVGA